MNIEKLLTEKRHWNQAWLIMYEVTSLSMRVHLNYLVLVSLFNLANNMIGKFSSWFYLL